MQESFYKILKKLIHKNSSNNFEGVIFDTFFICVEI